MATTARAASPTTSESDGDLSLAYLLLTILAVMILSLIYIVRQMRELKYKLEVETEAMREPGYPSRMRKKTTEPPVQVAENEVDDDIFGVMDPMPGFQKDMKNYKAMEKTSQNLCAPVASARTVTCDLDGDVDMAPVGKRRYGIENMPTKQVDFDGIREKLSRDGLDGVPAVVKVSERVMRHYHPNGEHITKDEANRLANGVAFYVADDGSTQGRLRMRGAYCSLGQARTALMA